MAPAEKNDGSAVELVRDEAGALVLTDGVMRMSCDLSASLPRLRADRLGRELVRAARVRGVDGPTCVDCTAGLGEDSLLLAAAGFRVTMFERDPTIAALLADGLARAAADPALADVVARMRLVEGDSVAGLASLGFTPDVVYLDPMFPGRTKSAAVKKKFQLLHHLERRACLRPAQGRHQASREGTAACRGKAVVQRFRQGRSLRLPGAPTRLGSPRRLRRLRCWQLEALLGRKRSWRETLHGRKTR